MNSIQYNICTTERTNRRLMRLAIRLSSCPYHKSSARAPLFASDENVLLPKWKRTDSRLCYDEPPSPHPWSTDGFRAYERRFRGHAERAREIDIKKTKWEKLIRLLSSGSIRKRIIFRSGWMWKKIFIGADSFFFLLNCSC